MKAALQNSGHCDIRQVCFPLKDKDIPSRAHAQEANSPCLSLLLSVQCRIQHLLLPSLLPGKLHLSRKDVIKQAGRAPKQEGGLSRPCQARRHEANPQGSLGVPGPHPALRGPKPLLPETAKGSGEANGGDDGQGLLSYCFSHIAC